MARAELTILILAGVSMALGIVLTRIVLSYGRSNELLDTSGAPGHEKVLRGVPNIGGIAIFAAITLPLIALLIWASAGSAHELAGAIREDRYALAVLIVSLFGLHALGLIDDRKPLPALPKLVAMTFLATVPVALLDIRLLTLFDTQPGGVLLSTLLSILWILAITNAINFLDNMDGVCAGITTIIGAVLLVIALRTGDLASATLMAGVAGSSLGFMVWNRPRALIFMGDGGSLVLGFALAVTSVRLTYFDANQSESPWTAVFVPLAVFAVPVYDLVSVIVIRISQGKSPLVGDQQHFTHRIRKRVLSDRRTLFIVLGCAIVTGMSGLLMLSLPPALAPVAGMQVLLILIILAVYERGMVRTRSEVSGL
ncbi:MAG: MraY family glycosyltransferase [Phycisphaerales bacterium JB050]